MTYLVLLLIAVVAGWRIRHWLQERASAQQAADARAAAFMAEVAARHGVPMVDAPRPAVEHSGETTLWEPPPVVVAAKPARSYLKPVQAQAYRVLRAAWPEGEVFPRSSLRAVLGREAVEHDMRLDFVVCDATLRVLAAADLQRSVEAHAGDAVKRARLEREGICHLSLDPARLPHHTELRARLLQAMARRSESSANT